MIPLSEVISRLALTHVWQVTLVAGGVGLATRCCCRRRPQGFSRGRSDLVPELRMPLPNTIR